MKGSGKTPLKLKGNSSVVPENAEMYYYLDLQPAEGAEILASAEVADGFFFKKTVPVLFRTQLGKGSITVLGATACGPDNEKSFWNTDLVKNILTGLIK